MNHSAAWRQARFGCRQAALISLSLTLAACATKLPQYERLPELESLALTSKSSRGDLLDRGRHQSRSAYAKGGAKGGAYAGLEISGACGPWFWLCALGTVPAGALVGAAGGAAAGAVVDASTQPTQEQLDQLDAIFVSIDQQRELHEDLRKALAQRIPADRWAEPDIAGGLLEVTVNDVRFARAVEDVYALTISAGLTLQWGRDRKGRRTQTVQQDHACPPNVKPIGDWLAGGAPLFNQVVDECIESLAEEIGKNIRWLRRKAAWEDGV